MFRIVFAATIWAGGALAQAQPAANVEACVESVRECLTREPKDQGLCFTAAGQHSDCTGTKLGSLAMLRGELSPRPTAAQGEPQLVDRQCLENFDAELSSRLLIDGTQDEEAQSLRERLEQCRFKEPINVNRQ